MSLNDKGKLVHPIISFCKYQVKGQSKGHLIFFCEENKGCLVTMTDFKIEAKDELMDFF
jgi:hypothetical protein